jgi:hypothetical protein
MPKVKLGYDALNIFQHYWWGQWDPLYAMLSRRGNSVDWVTLDVSEDELERFKDVARDIVEKSDDSSEVRVAKKYLDELKGKKTVAKKAVERIKAKKASGPKRQCVVMETGYAYELDDPSLNWKTCPSEYWNMEVIVGGEATLLGRRKIDDADCIVMQKGKHIYAQTVVSVKECK